MKLTKFKQFILLLMILIIMKLWDSRQKLSINVNLNEKTFEFVNFSSVKQKLPNAIIIGAAKCATTALLEFIAAHPNVVGNSSKEIYYFSSVNNYKKGQEWYRQQMPYSNENQITIEKTPTYFTDLKSPERVYKLNSKMKIIVIVCDPVVRCVSHYTHEKVNGKNWAIKSSLSKGMSDSEILKMLLLHGPDRLHSIPIFRDGFYYDHIQNWLRYFPLSQILFINGQQLKQEPSVEIDKLQLFLNLEPLIKKEHFVYNETRGLYCIRNPITSEVKCMDADKGRKHPQIDTTILNDIKKLYRPYDQKLFNLINETPWWTL